MNVEELAHQSMISGYINDIKEEPFNTRLHRFAALVIEAHTKELLAGSGEPVAHLCQRESGFYDVLSDKACKQCFPVYTKSQMAAAVLAYKQDAERYRWLKDNCSYHYPMQPDSPAEHGIEYQWQQGTYEERNQGIDGSIDAAIRKGDSHAE